MIPTGKRVKIKKVAAVESPKYRSATWEEYIPGEANPNVSIPVEWEAVGKVVMWDIEEDSTIMLAREERNGVKVFGVFNSSSVTKLEKGTDENQFKAETLNSVYLIEVLEDEPEPEQV